MSISAQREESLFEEARRLTRPGDREAFLERVCGGDYAMRRRLEDLLASGDEAESFFADSVVAVEQSIKNALARPGGNGEGTTQPPPPPGEELLSSLIGPYKLLQKIGEGGCGAVYMAEQERPVRRRVALKVIKLGMDTKAVIARFEAERQALALMDHPNIARVLDAGATDTGRPYFVMELVHGVKITEYCDENRLDTHQRLELFLQICSAIQHAHQKGIIHRDIKPSNILITHHDGVPVPKVIDFGIAKATEGRLTDRTLFTAYAHFVGTPAYMSPEQAEFSGLDVDTRSDIYSLGVLLYELLIGRTPFGQKELVESGLEAMRRTLREREPERPSVKLNTLREDELTKTAVLRHAEPPRLISQLRGDLDWIVMKCLEKDRNRRYETANGLALDLKRHLNNEAVLARPPSRLYQFGKLVRRNRVVFASGVAVAAALLIGLGTSWWMFLREREARQLAQEMERQQVRLREQAERGRATEAELRRQAEAREQMAQAAVLLSLNRVEEADAVMSELSVAHASLEGATLYRVLGDWHALHGDWDLAAERFAQLVRVSQIEPGDISSLDHTRHCCVLLERGDLPRYDQFRKAIVRQFAGKSDVVAAERTVKISLLTPADAELMEQLSPLAQLAADSFSAEDSQAKLEEWMLPWRCVSMALWEYRNARWNQSAYWSRRCLNYGATNPSRTATARLLLGMGLQRLGQSYAANAEWLQARELIQSKLSSGLDFGNGAEGFWFDWILARILLREAQPLFIAQPAANGSGGG